MVTFNNIIQTLALSTLALSSAPKPADSPEGAKYIATFDDSVTGSVEFSSTKNGSVQVDVNLSNLPSSGGPFLYHVHAKPVPSNGNCTGTLGHLNPYNGSETNTEPQDKEVGDLSGKHGTIHGQSIETSYVDDYISLSEDNSAFVGNLSVVVHLNNTTRIACSNITEESNNSSSSSSTVAVSIVAENGSGFISGSGVLIGAAFAGLSLLI